MYKAYITMESKIMNMLWGSQKNTRHSTKPYRGMDEQTFNTTRSERHHRVRSKAGVVKQGGLRFSKLPASSSVTSPYSSLQNFKGVVVPMGHGKTTLAEEEGWVDIDALLPSRVLVDAREDFYDIIRSANSVDEASLVMAKEVGPALKLLNPAEPVIFMAPTRGLLDALGIECVGAVAVNPVTVIAANSSREVHEKALIERNVEEVVAMDGKDGISVYQGDSLDDVRFYIYCVCQHLSIPISQPKMFDMDESTIRDNRFGGSNPLDLPTVVDAYYRGLIPREVVNFQIRANGLRSYMGFGYTWNDWGKVMSYANSTRGGQSFDDDDWAAWPVTLTKLSEGIPMEQHDDIQLLLEAHKGEHERFVLSVILHWKAFGLPSALANRLFPLYCVRRLHWGSVFDKIREGVIASNTLMGMPLTKEEREMILSMRLMSAGSISQLQAIMNSQGGSYPRTVPDSKQEENIERALSKVKYAIADNDSKEMDFAKLASTTTTREINNVNWSGKLKLREQIVKAIGMELKSRWANEPDHDRRIARLLKGILIRWYKACVIRDEWSDMACRLLEKDTLDMPLSHAIAAMLSCDIETGTSGLDWSIRIIECLKSFMVCGLVIESDAHIVMQTSKQGLRPCIIGLAEAEIWNRIAKRNVPRNAMGHFASGVGGVQRLMEIGVWSRSKTIMLMEMVNSRSWMPKATDRMLLCCLVRWKRFFKTGEEEYIFAKLANCYTEKILGRRYKSVADRLDVLSTIDARDGGLECTDTPCRGSLVTKNNSWTGHGEVKILKRVAKVRVERTLDKMLDDYENDMGEGTHRISSYGMYKVGLATVMLLKAEKKSRLNLHCELVERFGGP